MKLWQVCGNEALHAIAEARPSSPAALRKIGAFPVADAERYGTELLAEIAAFRAAESEPAPQLV